jgi:hypothetical protein
MVRMIAFKMIRIKMKGSVRLEFNEQVASRKEEETGHTDELEI